MSVIIAIRLGALTTKSYCSPRTFIHACFKLNFDLDFNNCFSMHVRFAKKPILASGNLSFLIVDGISYLLHPQPLAKVTELLPSSQPIPVVVLTISAAISSVDKAFDLIDRFASIDDVYSQSFAHTLILQKQNTIGSDYDGLLYQFQASGRFSAVYFSDPGSSSAILPSGPYFLSEDNIHQAYRLYKDELDSFIFGVIPEDVLNPKRFSVLPSLNGLWSSIAVPSRLYATPTVAKPLAGSRMGIKDIFRLEGTQLTMMSRPWTELYGLDEESAEYIKKLIQLGAVIVGKTKMTSFASPEEPTDQWVDFHCPFNPRGDGYQSPSSSSTGAGTSLAGYHWLDFSIAGDSAGSVRAPAPCSGLFSLRPSFGSTSMKGILTNSPKFDTVGQFGRSLDDLHRIVSHTFENIHHNFSGFPSKILYPSEFYPLANAKQQALTEEFISILEDFLGVRRTSFSFAKEWDKRPPEKAGGMPLLKYTEKSAFHALCYDYYHGSDKFRNEYKAKFGKDAFVSSVVGFRWGVGKEVTSEEYEAYLKQLEVFRDWFSEHLMGPNSESLSTAILVMPYGEPNPEYRDDPNPPAGTFHTITEKFISPILHAPQLVLPFAQMPYHSRISGRDEVRPIASTLIGAKGSDLMLIKLAAEAFKKASWPTIIQTGRYMYPLANNSRNVGPAIGDSFTTYEAKRQAIQEVQNSAV
ncbi:putative amidase [Xylaria scruposa]|nr:putative amidase [Xylaria scruposa]